MSVAEVVRVRKRALPTQWPVNSPGVDTTPEHTKMAPYVQENWAIRDFLTWCAGRNVHLVHSGADGITRTVGHVVLENLIARFRQVDPDAYRAEGRMLIEKYRHLLPSAPAEPEDDSVQLSLLDGFDTGDSEVIKVIEVLDSLRVPVAAGRTVCSTYLNDANIPLPETAVLARAVKFRKTMYGVKDNYAGRFNSVDPRRKVHTPKVVRSAGDHDEDAISSLMAKLGAKGNEDAAQD